MDMDNNATPLKAASGAPPPAPRKSSRPPRPNGRTMPTPRRLLESLKHAPTSVAVRSTHRKRTMVRAALLSSGRMDLMDLELEERTLPLHARTFDWA